jgi:hypothetical protein
VRSFPSWFERYLFADVKPAAGVGGTDSVPRGAGAQR